jgi:hypothetical protein
MRYGRHYHTGRSHRGRRHGLHPAGYLVAGAAAVLGTVALALQSGVGDPDVLREAQERLGTILDSAVDEPEGADTEPGDAAPALLGLRRRAAARHGRGGVGLAAARVVLHAPGCPRPLGHGVAARGWALH